MTEIRTREERIYQIVLDGLSEIEKSSRNLYEKNKLIGMIIDLQLEAAKKRININPVEFNCDDSTRELTNLTKEGYKICNACRDGACR